MQKGCRVNDAAPAERCQDAPRADDGSVRDRADADAARGDGGRAARKCACEPTEPEEALPLGNSAEAQADDTAGPAAASD